MKDARGEVKSAFAGTLFPRSLSGGFTLLELILVSVVLSILLAAAVPRFQQTAQRLRAEQTAFECAQLLRMAHERAIAEGRDIVWVWNPQARRIQLYHVVTSDQTESLEAIDERAARSAPFQQPVHLRIEQAAGHCPDGLEPEAACIRFFSAGTSEATTLTLEIPHAAFVVTVDETTSRVALTRPSEHS